MSTLAMCSLLHSGSNSRLANRSPKRFKTVDRPRKWSTRCTCSSLTSSASSWLSATALCASVPNGFSSTRAVPAGSDTSLSAVQLFTVTAGGRAK
jgi:hypothetical protein